MKVLYVFPHPDDESFGPARAMHKQLREGHEVYLLTLTRGGATKQRHRLGYTVEQMGAVRYEEMKNVAKVLGLSGMTVLDLPDSGLKEIDPRVLEREIAVEIARVQPHVVVTYAVHGISGFHDHLVAHAVVKRVFVEIKRERPRLQRLALFTISEEEAKRQTHFRLSGSTQEEIDCAVEVAAIDIEANIKALDCYETYMEVIEPSGIKQALTPTVHFEFWQEHFNPLVSDMFAGLNALP